jgi:predicted nucleic acid-binding protein
VSEKLVLDSFALLSLYHREPAGGVVQKALYDQDKARTLAVLNWINWGEFFYIVKRRVGPVQTTDALHLLEQLPIELYPIDPLLVRAAAEIKSEHTLSYADAFLHRYRPTSQRRSSD